MSTNLGNEEFQYFSDEQAKPYNIKDRAYLFSKETVLAIKDIKIDTVYLSLFDQLIRSATSIGANLVEGHAGNSNKDWQRFTHYSLKSANETKYWLKLILDTQDCDKIKFQSLLNECIEISNIIGKIKKGNFLN